MPKNVEGTWDVIVANGANVRFNLLQKPDGELSGSADSDGTFTEDCTGQVTDTDFLFTVTWSPESVKEYSGRFNLVGRLGGSAVDLKRFDTMTAWTSDKMF
jgi:hypothetical protein